MRHPGFRYVCSDCGDEVRKADTLQHRAECPVRIRAREAEACQGMVAEWVDFLESLPVLETR
jgi:DNA-directed RNA polymerase subunit RPC12/RpoP